MNDPSKMMNQSQGMKKNQSQMMNQSHMLSMSQPQQMFMNQSQMVMSQSQSQQQMLNRGGGGGGYGMWPPAEQLKFQNPMNFPGFVSSSSAKPLGRGNWKGKKGNNDKRKEGRRKEKSVIGGSGSVIGGASGGLGIGGVSVGGGGGYKPPTLQELQHQNRLKARRYFPKKKFNNRSAPFAPRNTTSFIIRAKKSGGIASLVSPCPVTPAVLPTPIFSPSREALVDTAKEEWGVDGYGSMKGLIRLRSPGNDLDAHEDEEEDEGGSSESDVEEHLEVERRLDHDLSRFEMIYPNYGAEYNNVLENRVDDQDTHIAQVEEENLILKERLFLMEREMADLRRRLMCLERRSQVVDEINEEVVENESDNESDSRGYSFEMVEENNEGRSVEAKEENNEENVVEVNNEGRSVETKEENNEENVMEVNNEGRSVEAKEENNEENVMVKNNESQSLEAKEENNEENVLNNSVGAGGDVCMEELEHAENMSKDEGEGKINESLEKSIGDCDLSKSPTSIVEFLQS